ncbi:MAG: PIN domain-containing protein [Chthoniobacteraceae bacterium]
MSRTQYIFVDYENVPDVDLALLAGKAAVVEVVLGEQHKSLPLAMVDRLMEYREQIKLVKTAKSGRNALDFVLAYRVGVASTADAEGYFHIVSRDTGFDALVAYLHKNKILARRDESFAKAFATEPPSVATAADRANLVINRLKKSNTNRPKRKKTLLSQINSYFGNKLTAAELEDIVQTLTSQRIVAVGEKGSVSYNL